MNYNIAVFPGDGIGPEVMGEGTQVLKQVAQLYGFTVSLEPGIVGGASIDAHGKPLTEAVLNLAKQSDPIAEHELAKMYAAGRGVPPSEKERLVWLERAADHGNADAQYEMGLALRYGRGVIQDYGRAASWL
ncbi:MAG: isocitrate/isopropylmalate family dehydrogenase, partial [Candidatus Binatia bacterium]